MKKSRYALLAFFVQLMLTNTIFATFSGGSGTEEDPYRISSVTSLLMISDPSYHQNPINYFKLINDIDLSDYSFSQSPIASEPPFAQCLDGNGYKIKNLTISASEGEYIGLFNKIGNSGSVSNLSLENVNISGNEYVGGICGENYGEITNCYVSGSVNGYYINGGICGQNFGTITDSFSSSSVAGNRYSGGLCGYNYSGTINNCYTTGQITGDYNVGGVCGKNFYGTVSNCYATGSISSSQNFAGGLCGTNEYGTITSCYATGSVIGNDNIGGLCGRNYGIITDSFSTGSVSANYYAGGLCGYNFTGSITSCYSTGSVSSNNYASGLCGFQFGSNANISNSFWNIETSSLTVGYDLSPSNPGTIDNVQGLTTDQMLTQSYYLDAGWDFSDTDGNPADWQMVRPGEDYPRLAWQQPIAGDTAGLWGVDMIDLEDFLANWLQEDPTGTDLTDFAEIAVNWLVNN